MIRYSYEQYKIQSLVRAIYDGKSLHDPTTDTIVAHHANNELILKLYDFIESFRVAYGVNPSVSIVAERWHYMMREQPTST